MDWYLQKSDGGVYGPVDMQHLVQWSTEGRLDPSDNVSTDKKTWKSVADMPQFNMDWLVQLADGQEYGPLHMLALAHLVDDGKVEASSQVRHKITGESHVLSEALLGVLMDRNASIQSSFDQINMQMLKLEAEVQSLRPSEEVDPQAPPALDLRKNLKELASRADYLQKENTRWKNLYESERAKSGRKIDQLNARIEELRQSDAQGRTRLEESQRRLKQLEHSYSTLMKAADAATGTEGASEVARQFGDLLEAYNQISHSHDKLYEQLRDMVRQNEKLVASRKEAEEVAGKRVSNMENILEREQAEADEARRQLVAMQETHFQLAKSFREMNNRFINMRQQWSGKRAVAPSEAPKDAPVPPKPERGGKSGPKIRLNR